MTPECYDELLDSLHQAHDHARREGDELAARVFEDASYAAAHVAGLRRELARGEGIYAPGESAAKAPSEDATGFTHRECLSVVLVD